MIFDNGHLYSVVPIAYMEALQSTGNREKARCFIEYAIDLDRGRIGSYGFYSKSWVKSKETTYRWVGEFKNEIEKFHTSCMRKNDEKIEKMQAKKNQKSQTIAKRSKDDNQTNYKAQKPKKQVDSEVVPNDCQTITEQLPKQVIIEKEKEKSEDISSSSSWIEEEGYTNEEVHAAAYNIAMLMRAKSPHMYVTHLLHKAAAGDEGTRENLRSKIYTTRMLSVNVFDVIKQYYGEEQQ